MTISPDSGVPTAGQPYSLTCSVETVPGLVVNSSIQWTSQDGSLLNTSSGSSLELSFNPLRTSNGSMYTCHASVHITDIDVFVSGEKSREIAVMSKSFGIFSSSA